MMLKKVFREKKIIAELCATALFLIGVLLFVYRNDLRIGVRLQVEAMIQNKDSFELKADDVTLMGRLKPGNFQTITFKLPKKEIKTVRLFMGKNPGPVVVRWLKLKTPLNEYGWRGANIKKLINFSQNIKKTSVVGTRLFIEPEKGSPSLKMAPLFSKIINKISGNKTLYYFSAFILALIFFFFVHNINLQGIRQFFNRKVLVNSVLIFFIIIFSSIFNDIFKLVKPAHLMEKRKLARYFEFRFDSLFEYLSRFGNYFADHFSLRSHLVKINNKLRFEVFNKSAVPMVVIGKKGWLFMGEETESRDEREYFRRLEPFSEKDLEYWRLILEQRQMWLAKRGIHYLLIIVPNKSTIYPEFMPDHLRPLPNPSRLDQLLEYVGNNTAVKILDLRIPLMDAKKSQQVYSKTDSHWNQFGAHVAYSYIMDYLASVFPGEKSIPLSEFRISRKNWAGGDLATALSLQQRVLREERVWLKRKNPREIKKTVLGNIAPYVSQSLLICKLALFPPAICVHDSFLIELRPFLSQHFSQIRYIWDWEMNVYPDLIRNDQVKIVIDEMGERYLMDKVLTNPEEIRIEN